MVWDVLRQVASSKLLFTYYKSVENIYEISTFFDHSKIYVNVINSLNFLMILRNFVQYILFKFTIRFYILHIWMTFYNDIQNTLC